MNSFTRPGIMLASIAFAATALVGCGAADEPAKTTPPVAAPSAKASTTATATPSAPDAHAPSAGPTAAPAAGGETVVVGGKEISGLPTGFTFPTGTVVDVAVPGSMVTLSQPSGAEIAAFYRTELPKTGFNVDLDTGSPDTMLMFSSASWSVQVAANADSGATITWAPATGTTPTTPAAPSSPTQSPDGSSTGTPTGPVVLGEDGISNGDFSLPFPSGTQIADLVDTPDKAAFSFTSPAPAEVLAFYRGALPGSADFTIDSDETSGSTTTLSWHSDEANIILVVDGSSARMTLTPR